MLPGSSGAVQIWDVDSWNFFRQGMVVYEFWSHSECSWHFAWSCPTLGDSHSIHIYNCKRILLFKHFDLDVSLEWGLCSQLWTVEEVLILANAEQVFSEQVQFLEDQWLGEYSVFPEDIWKAPVPAAWDLRPWKKNTGEIKAYYILKAMFFLLWLMPLWTGTLDFSYI